MKKSPADLQREREALVDDDLNRFLHQHTNEYPAEDFAPGKMSVEQFRALYKKLQKPVAAKQANEQLKPTDEQFNPANGQLKPVKEKTEQCSDTSAEINFKATVSRRMVDLNDTQEELLYRFRKQLRQSCENCYPFNDEDIIRVLIDLLADVQLPDKATIRSRTDLRELLKSIMYTKTKG